LDNLRFQFSHLATVTLVVFLTAASAFAGVPRANASGNSVTPLFGNVSGCDCQSLLVQLPYTVQPGDIVLVGVTVASGTISTVSDNFSNQYSLAVSESEWAAIYVGVVSSFGYDNVTVTLDNQGWMNVYVLVVSGATTENIATGTGSCGFNCTGIASTSPVSLQPGSFVFGVTQFSDPTPSVTPGANYSLDSYPVNTGVAGYAEFPYLTTVSSPATFAMNDSSSNVLGWMDVGVALQPSPVSVTSTTMLTTTHTATRVSNFTSTQTSISTLTNTQTNTQISPVIVSATSTTTLTDTETTTTSIIGGSSTIVVEKTAPANDNSLLYGSVAVVLALAAGASIGAFMIRRRSLDPEVKPTDNSF
jgi:hypothetical protein